MTYHFEKRLWSASLGILLTILLAIGLFGCVVPKAFGQELPVPAKPFEGFVLDTTKSLTQGSITNINTIAKGLETTHKTTFVVLVIPTLNGEDIASYAHRVAEAWSPGVGDAGKGVLILIAKNDRKSRIEISKNLEGDLPDAFLKDILGQSSQFFKNGNFGDGILFLIKASASNIKTGQEVPVVEEDDNCLSSAILWGISLLLGLGAGGFAINAFLAKKAREEAEELALEKAREAEMEALSRKIRDREAVHRAKESLRKTPPVVEDGDSLPKSSSKYVRKNLAIPPAPAESTYSRRSPSTEKSSSLLEEVAVAAAVSSVIEEYKSRSEEEDTRPSSSWSSDSSSSSFDSFSSSSSSDFGGGGSSGSWD